jgi:hypothetical protein
MSMVEAIVVGAEPYGLSVAAHLLAANIGLQIIGQPMKCWRKHMPIGMKLKPEPLASNFLHECRPCGRYRGRSRY